MYGNDITIINAGITHVITPTIPLYDHFRIVGTATLVGNVSIALDGSFTPTKWDVICFDWEATVTLGTSTVTIFGTTLTKEQCLGKGFIHCMYNGSSWDVRYYTSITDKATGIGSGATSTALTNGGGTITMDITKNDNTLVLTGSPTLSSSWTVVAGGTPRAGDMQICHYKATATVGVNTITILGQLLTTAQALAGNSIVISSYDGSSWRTVLIDADVQSIWEVGSGTNSCQTLNATTQCNATGAYAVADGRLSVASGQYSKAVNYSNDASGDNSFACNNDNESSGDNSFSCNEKNKAIGSNSFAAGTTSEAIGVGSVVIGKDCYAPGYNARATGVSAVAHLDMSKAWANTCFAVYGDCQNFEKILKASTTDATPTNLTDGIVTGIEIPEDCVANVSIRMSAVQISGIAGTPGDSWGQDIKLKLKNIAGTITILPTTATTVAGVQTVASDVTYILPSNDAAISCSAAISIVGSVMHVQFTGEVDKNIRINAAISMVWIGWGNFDLMPAP